MSLTTAGRPKFDQRTAIFLGVACYLAGSYLIFDAYDRRGARKPWLINLFPGT